MIIGIGTDVCDITRIAAALDRHGDRFAQRVLGPDELRVFEARRARVPRRGLSYLATRFSAKEAFSKAIGLGMHAPMSWRSCEVINVPGGKPEIRLHGALAHGSRSAGCAPSSASATRPTSPPRSWSSRKCPHHDFTRTGRARRRRPRRSTPTTGAGCSTR